MVASVLLPVQPKKTGTFGDFILAHSTMIFFFSSGASIEVSPVEPMISTADVPCSAWNLSSVWKAAKSTEPSLLNGVISATNEPVMSFLDIRISKLKNSIRDIALGCRVGKGAPLRAVPTIRRGPWCARCASAHLCAPYSALRWDENRRRERPHLRRRLGPALDADIEGQHVGIAVPLG